MGHKSDPLVMSNLGKAQSSYRMIHSMEMIYIFILIGGDDILIVHKL